MRVRVRGPKAISGLVYCKTRFFSCILCFVCVGEKRGSVLVFFFLVFTYMYVCMVDFRVKKLGILFGCWLGWVGLVIRYLGG